MMLKSFEGNDQDKDDDDDWDTPNIIVEQQPKQMNSQRQQSSQNIKVNEVTNTFNHHNDNGSMEENKLDDLDVISDW